MAHPLLPGITSRIVETPRLRQHVLSSGDPAGTPVVFLDGNLSTARFWEETMLALPPSYLALAPDMRGYGDSEPKPIDATRGMRDFSDDLRALLGALGLLGKKVHLVGWSAGSAVAMQYAIDNAGGVASLTLTAPMSPYGFGGTRDTSGKPTSPDWAGTGGGTASKDLVERMRAGDTGADSPFSPRVVLRQFYFKAPFSLPQEREDVFVEEILKTRLGDDNYPGDLVTVATWPGVAPGDRGMNNAISGKHCDVSAFAEVAPGPDVLWIRGADDQIVSDTSLFDLSFLGQIGAVPGWPGLDACPPQPMIGQMRAVLDAYSKNGGRYEEIAIPDCGHSPHLEKPGIWNRAVFDFIAARSR